MDSIPTTNEAKGEPTSIREHVLHTGASMLQNFDPVKHICAHLHAAHTPFDDPGKAVEAHHYCTILNEDMRQCIVYDGKDKNARLIGIEYLITRRLYETLGPEERKLWHSHVFEVKSGLLALPVPSVVPDSVWEAAETAEMEAVIGMYGKVYHLWRTDLGHQIPLGAPQLFTSFTSKEQFDFDGFASERDRRLGTDTHAKSVKRAAIAEPEIHGDADAAWKK